MQSANIAFIGGGNMARSLIGGLIADGCDPQRIHVADPQTEVLEQLRSRFNVVTAADNHRAVAHADVVVLAVKPQVLPVVAADLAAAVQKRHPLIISIVAGIRETDINRWLGGGLAVVRVMPNTPALVQSGASALYANPQVDEAQRDLAESILRAVGLAIWVEREAMMDAVTALSGSGPAYFFLFMEALQQAGERLGLPADTARLLTLQTAFGAAKMALESSEDAAILRQRVTSPGGTTERALTVFEQADFMGTVVRALEAAATRSEELAKELGDR